MKYVAVTFKGLKTWDIMRMCKLHIPGLFSGERGLGMRLVVSLLRVYGTLKQPKQPEIRKKLGIYLVLGNIKSTQSRYIDTSNVMISLNIDMWFPESNMH